MRRALAGLSLRVGTSSGSADSLSAGGVSFRSATTGATASPKPGGNLMESLLPTDNEDAQLLLSALSDRVLANKLIQLFMQDTSCPDYQRLVLDQDEFDKEMRPTVNKLRCVLAVQELHKAIADPQQKPTERLARARKIVAMFIQCGSSFHVSDVPKELASSLLLVTGDNSSSKPAAASKDFAYFTNLANFCLVSLLANDVFMQQTRELVMTSGETNM